MIKKTTDLFQKRQIIRILIFSIIGVMVALIFSVTSPAFSTLTPNNIVSVMSTFTGFTLTALIFAKNFFMNLKSDSTIQTTFRKGAVLLIFQFTILLLFIVLIILFDFNPNIKFYAINIRAFFLYFLLYMFLVNMADIISGLYQILLYSRDLTPRGEK
ncbi:hypothetical protein N7548_00085 [Acholeplasma manati]|uniref:Uncharacterized protein n=1 Tax=Paracholeplasma manati TaxID=591373 RepID=A0ABT2Y443_9MOLU|nr:hypothetical protein [Paracholeplasma manati]MCV2231223.1 hypothetical protein [Paracholeplasma manati]